MGTFAPAAKLKTRSIAGSATISHSRGYWQRVHVGAGRTLERLGINGKRRTSSSSCQWSGTDAKRRFASFGLASSSQSTVVFGEPGV